MRLTAPFALVLLAGCRATTVVGPPLPVIHDSATVRTVALEPFFESAQWQVNTRAENARVYSPYGGPSRDVVVQRQVAEKPLFARVPVLADQYLRVLEEVRRLRPQWRVVRTSQLPESGEVVLVRTLIADTALLGSDRALKGWLALLGLGIPGFFLTVNEATRVYGQLSRFEADAGALKSRRVRYPTQPDFAVDVRGLPVVQQPFGLELAYEDGVYTTVEQRERALALAFPLRLATAIVALVEAAEVKGTP